MVKASSNYTARIGNEFYDNLEEAIKNASGEDIIILTSNALLEETLEINKIVNLNLNGHDVIASSMPFLVQGGMLNLSGKGTIKESKPNYGAIIVKGSSNSASNNYSVVNVSKDVNLEGWSGIFVNHQSSLAYGVVVNFEGKINAVNDVDGKGGIGIYVNGNIQHQNNIPTINILDGAKIVSSGNGLYIAGNSIFNIGRAYISGMESGIGIKAGILKVNGATVESLGDDYTPTVGDNNGLKASGTAIQIESNNSYAGNMEIDIKDGNFRSRASNVIYEYIGRGNSSLVKMLNISGGNFESAVFKDVFLLSDSFRSKHNKFIEGGTYSSNPSLYLKSGYTVGEVDDGFEVIKSTMKEVSFSNFGESAGSKWWVLIVGGVFVVALVFVGVLFNRRKKVF